MILLCITLVSESHELYVQDNQPLAWKCGCSVRSKAENRQGRWRNMMDRKLFECPS